VNAETRLKIHVQREIMRVARNSDRAKRVIPARLFAAARIMAERGLCGCCGWRLPKSQAL
jgi:hypothetical protein